MDTSTTPTLFKAIISHEELDNLRKLLEKVIYILYSPAIQVEKNATISTSLSIHIEDEWINFTNSWLETPHDIGYYKLNIGIDRYPVNIQYSREKNTFEYPVSSFVFNRGVADQTVKKIEVYCKDETWDNENIIYDFAIIFHIENGLRLSVSVLEDISEQLECSTDTSIIESMMTVCRLRYTIE